MFLNIFLNNVYISIMTNCINIISTRPKITASELVFNFWVKAKEFFCRYTFYRSNYYFNRNFWNALDQKMNMIFVRANFYKMDFISFRNLLTYFNQTIFNWFRQNTSSIFYRTNQMIQQQTFIMTLFNMLIHYTNIRGLLTHTPRQSLEEFTRLKILIQIC